MSNETHAPRRRAVKMPVTTKLRYSDNRVRYLEVDKLNPAGEQGARALLAGMSAPTGHKPRLADSEEVRPAPGGQ